MTGSLRIPIAFILVQYSTSHDLSVVGLSQIKNETVVLYSQINFESLNDVMN